MQVLHDAWGALILRDVFVGLTRFDQLQQDLGLSRKVLAARLDSFVVEGILEKRAYAEHPPRYDYVPTAKGAELFGVIAALMAWGDRWKADKAGPPARIRHDCGALATARVTCDQCGEPLLLETVATEAGPGGRLGPGTRMLGKLLSQRSKQARKTTPM
ncbi:MAG: Transcriptional regulator, HxlR family [Hydrocarboniphaga sp.]|nr:Transcriptional regulator, HxlR family [Hydrocarboniphaga sp.]